MSDSATDVEQLIETARVEPERWVRCAACETAVADRDAMFEMHGSVSHTFTNPVGLTYRISCFRDAPGCLVTGRPTQDDTWFSGWAWALAHCEFCGKHLGWCYERGSDGFFALIVDRIVVDGGGS